jgi:hypothetical protein
MPIEILTREELEKLVEEKIRKLLSEMEIWKKIAELELSTAKLRDDIARLSVAEKRGRLSCSQHPCVT